MMSSATSTTATPSEPSSNGNGDFDLVGLLLAEQQSLSAVERFSALHESGQLAAGSEPAQAQYYRDLLPASPPGPGQQFAFSVDLDSCSGCKACVVACHTLNGLEESESWRRVGTVRKPPSLADQFDAEIKHVTTACHHCEDPGCLNGCPVKAYDKDSVTGIVRHLDDQCIGCKYCTMMCPYEVPQYSHRLGIVRKCDMCHQRLSVGEAPACVQSCPNEAIAIQVVDTPGRDFGEQHRLAPGAPLSTITRPTTTYHLDPLAKANGVNRNGRNGSESAGGSRPAPTLQSFLPQDAGVDEVAESHWPLAVMLVMTQISVGMLLAERIVAGLFMLESSSLPESATRVNALVSFLVAAVGMGIAPLHLGQPLRAWRVFLGLRTSWLSREAVLFGKYMGALSAAVALLWLPVIVEYAPAMIADQLRTIMAWIPGWAAIATLGIALLIGVAGLYSSAMIYIATRRTLWRPTRTLTRFLGTSLVAGPLFTGVAFLISQAPVNAVVIVLAAALIAAGAKLAWEWTVNLGPGNQADDSYDRRSRLLIGRELSLLSSLRLIAGGATLVLLGAALATATQSLWIAIWVAAGLAATCVLVAEFSERLLYFCGVVYDRMPGTLR